MEPIKKYPRFKTRVDHDALRAEYGVEDVYRMGYNESPLGPSPKVVAAIRMAAAALGYYPPMGDERLRGALAQTWGRGLTADHFFTSCSGYEAIELVARAYIRPGDEVIVCPPTFGVYTKIVELEHGQVIEVPLTTPDFLPDVDQILAAVNAQTRLLIICNPNNPTGTMLPAADWDRLLQSLPEHVLVVADEVYCHFVESPDFPDTIRHVLAERPVVMIETFSKAYGLAGLRLGYGIAPPHIASAIDGIRRGFHQNRLSLIAGVTALADQEHLRGNVQAALDGKKYLYQQFDKLDLAYIPSQTNFVVVDIGRPVDELLEHLKSLGVLVKKQTLPGIEHGVRVSVSTQGGNEAFIAGLKSWFVKGE